MFEYAANLCHGCNCVRVVYYDLLEQNLQCRRSCVENASHNHWLKIVSVDRHQLMKSSRSIIDIKEPVQFHTSMTFNLW